MKSCLCMRIMFVLGLLIVIVAFAARQFLESVRSADRSARRCSCVSHLAMIGLALQNYQVHNGCFPPAYIADATGKPMHSWRILILPFLEQQDLYDQYHFDEPWNSPHNSRLAKLTPEVYRCPCDSDTDSTTSYLAVVGTHAAWQGTKALKYSDFIDGMNSTVLIVEVSDSGINWMEPRDLTFDEAVAGINRGSTLGIRSHHLGGANCGFANASPGWLYEAIAPATLKSLLTRDGGEDARQFLLEHKQPPE